MKNCYYLLLVFLLISCESSQDFEDPNCYEGTLIEQTHLDANQNVFAVRLSKPIEQSVEWKGEVNVVELVNIPSEYALPAATQCN